MYACDCSFRGFAGVAWCANWQNCAKYACDRNTSRACVPIANCGYGSGANRASEWSAGYRLFHCAYGALRAACAPLRVLCRPHMTSLQIMTELGGKYASFAKSSGGALNSHHEKSLVKLGGAYGHRLVECARQRRDALHAGKFQWFELERALATRLRKAIAHDGFVFLFENRAC